ncbi:MAG: tRNA guanosine(34) transglycosylase Tgt [Candidatus Peribacteraceae bacterium]|nr:tRNA guanosine(34) transglycosylase Tgt [Candidatus Peribacteraceae bacterium]MDD5742699.1 tRNA guanosine(34) transglycosylase Tgt [Candidatus Peribacteraceae bacterium]
MFTLQSSSPLGRRGRIETEHGPIETPFFFPVGTVGAMRGLTHQDLIDLKAQVLLCNTYHLHLHPGEDTVAQAGGLHAFIAWNRPILTDSGGYQVFSLRGLRHIAEDGVAFRAHTDGSTHFLGPREATEIQWKLKSDIIMCFDECPPSTASRREIETAVDRTLRWAKTCKDTHERLGNSGTRELGISVQKPLLFGIIQGGLHFDLRKKCAEELQAIGFDGYALGGLAVGESEEEMLSVLREITPLLPKGQPRYLMGVGVMHQLKRCVELGIDMFDCVLPMRIARHGTILLSDGTDLRITNAAFRNAHIPIDSASPSDLSRNHLRSYLHHLFRANERLAETIACKQNLGVTLKMMRDLRQQMDTPYAETFVTSISVNP